MLIVACQLLQMTAHSPVAAMRLFEPYWRTIAVTVVKDLQSRPQIAQRVCELLGLIRGVPDLLALTKSHTIPYLVLTKKRDILQRIADTDDGNHSIKSICGAADHLASIIACLLMQPSPDPEAMIRSLLCEASPDFADFHLMEIVKAYPTLITFELLKFAGEGDDTKTACVRPITTALRIYSWLTPLGPQCNSLPSWT